VEEAVRFAVDRAARAAYGRLVAFVAARSHDLAAAEDALSDAFVAALRTWPDTGIPDSPEAWLLVAARRRVIDEARHSQVQAAAAPLLAALDEAGECSLGDEVFPDERLKLMFICAHPAIDAAVRTPLMLQTVLGLDAARIASAFLVRPSAMGQRLSRAKTKIRAAGIAFEVPEQRDLPIRLAAVLDAIYAAYGRGWDDVDGADPRHPNLAAEAIDLGTMLVGLMPDEPEAIGLLALMLHTDARRRARRDEAGRYVPLSEQDPVRWDVNQLDTADAWLARASKMRRPGRYQLEAAIQSVHGDRRRTGETHWPAILLLYEGLLQFAPQVGPLLGHAAAAGEVHGASVGLTLIEQLPTALVQDHQPYWALKADLLRRLGRTDAAALAYRQAIALCEDSAMRNYLTDRARS
jgi:RNA polymerase sigma-70 factor (ECF subfamily)